MTAAEGATLVRRRHGRPPARAPLRVRRHHEEHRLRPRSSSARRRLRPTRGAAAHWCSREGQAQLLELMEAGDARQLVFAGCSQDFAARRLQKLLARGLQLEIADIREGCSWVHGDDVAAVTDKAARIVASSVALSRRARPTPWPTPTAATRCVVIGGGVAGTQAAAELAQMGHHGRAHRAAALPRRPRRPHRHRVPHQRLRPVPAHHRRPGRHAQVLPPQRRHRPPQPHDLAPRHRRVASAATPATSR